MKRAFIILTLFCFIFTSSFVAPTQKAEAALPFGLALPAAAKGAAGAYVLGGFAVAGVATLMGLEHGDEIRNHVTNVWHKTNEVTKDIFNSAIDGAMAVGQKVINLSNDMKNYIKSQGLKILGNAISTSVAINQSTAVKEEIGENDLGLSPTVSTAYPFVSSSYESTGIYRYWRQVFSINDPSYKFLIITDTAIFSTSEVRMQSQGNSKPYSSRIRLDRDTFDILYGSYTGSIPYYGGVYFNDTVSFDSVKTYHDAHRLFDRFQSSINNNSAISLLVVPLSEIDALVSKYSVAIDNFNSLVDGTDVFTLPQSMKAYKDTRVDNLTTQQLNDYVASNPSDELIYNPDTGGYVDTLGNDYTGGVTWVPEIPTVIDVDGIPTVVTPTLDGTYVDTITGDVVDGKPIDPTVPPSDGGILQGLWDWLKGILQSILDAIKALAGLLGILALLDAIKELISSIVSGIGIIVDAITTGLIGNVDNINWDRLKATGTVFSTKFPFSLPWDISRAMDAIFGGMSDSDGKWDIVLGVSTDNPTRITIEIPQYFDAWQRFGHMILLIIFDVGMIYAIRKLFGGAS